MKTVDARSLVERDEEADYYDRIALDELVRVLGKGTPVVWYHGQHLRHGLVVKVLGFCYHNASVRVQSCHSDKVYDVPASTIVAAMKKSI